MNKTTLITIFILCLIVTSIGLSQESAHRTSTKTPEMLTAKEILGNPNYRAFSYGGYRDKTRDIQPTITQLKEDLRVLSAMDVKVLRTYNTQQYAQAANLLEAIRELRSEKPDFEMYVMLGAWIDCEGAWSANANHEAENAKNNKAEIDAAVKLANRYPESVKFIAVGNEAMVHWAASYFVRPAVILKWVNHLQQLKTKGELGEGIWITSSDNFASWGGGPPEYRTDDLASLVKAVDFVSMHTYPFHDTHYDSVFWNSPANESSLSPIEKANAAMDRARDRAVTQYQSVADYVKNIDAGKPVHIGETGWATTDSSNYGVDGSRAADEYKSKRFYNAMREWSDSSHVTCFYFEAFDESWKDPNSQSGSENHFGMINLKGQAKYALWKLVDKGAFNGITRGGHAITKTYNGDEEKLKAAILVAPDIAESTKSDLSRVNDKREIGQLVSESKYVVSNGSLEPNGENDMTYPSAPIKLNAWEGTCNIMQNFDGIIQIATGNSDTAWWGCALEFQGAGKGEDFSEFKSGKLHFDIKSETTQPFTIGFQTGLYNAGNLVNSFVTFGGDTKYQTTNEWKSVVIPIEELNQGSNLKDVTAVLYLRGDGGDGKTIDIRNIYYSND